MSGQTSADLQHQFSILDCVPLGECVLQQDGTILFWNTCLERWTNLPRTQLLGQKIDCVFPHFKHAQSIRCLQATFEHGATLTFSSPQHPLIIPVVLNNQQSSLQRTIVTPLTATSGIGYDALLTIQDAKLPALHELRQPAQDWREEQNCPLDNKAHDHYSLHLRQQLNLCQQSDLRYQQERSVDRIVRHIRQSLNLREILQTTANEIQEFLNVDRVLIYRLGSTDSMGRVIAEARRTGIASLLEWTRKNAPLGQLECGEYLEFHRQQNQQYEVSVASDITQSNLNPTYVQFLKQFSVKARLCIPIFGTDLRGTEPPQAGRMQPNLWGWLVAHDCQTIRQWSAEEVHLLRHLESQLAVAIHQSELHQQVHQLNINLERQVHVRTLELQQALSFEATLKRITDNVRDSLDEQQILQTVVNELAKALEVHHCNTSLYNAHGNVPMLQCSDTGIHLSSDVQTIDVQHFPIEQFPEIYQQLSQGQYVPFCRLSSTDTSRFAILACPIVHEQEVLGDLWLFKPGASSFSELEVRLVEQVANQCAIGIRQARLYKAAQERAEELAQLNRLKDDFLSTISHELRTPIASIQMVIQTLELLFVHPEQTENAYITNKESSFIDDRDEDTNVERSSLLKGRFQQIHKYFHILEKECQREAKLIDDLLDLTRLDAGTEPLMLVPVRLQDWLPHVAETFERQIAEHQQSLHFELPEHLPVLMIDLTILERIVIELLNNACKYTPLGGAISISAGLINRNTAQVPSSQTVPMLQICVSNTGVEIPANELPHVFEKFYRIPSNDPWRYGGTGLGLALVKRMIEYLGGNIQVESQHEITCFTLELAIVLPMRN